MPKATISFNLSIPEDAFDYKCSMKGLDACLLLESLKHTVHQHKKHNLLPEVALQDIISQLEDWEIVK
jgi:hypothetical protein